jgi:hypothetical protein
MRLDSTPICHLPRETVVDDRGLIAAVSDLIVQVG